MSRLLRSQPSQTIAVVIEILSSYPNPIICDVIFVQRTL